MAMLHCSTPMVVKDTDLEDWEVKGSGGFGQIYKARHRQWCCDVAIKLLHYDDGNSQALRRELHMMLQGHNPHVIHVHGVFQGHPPSSGFAAQLGLVMEFMERGSLANLQQTLQGPPPWPLAFRLTHQIALGINFLHSFSPAVLHLDLKPSNVLLDPYLNAKLTDFGLARFSNSVTRASKKASEDEGGTLSYMPPEAFEISYDPKRASDIYSFGVLLWSLVTGRQPYANANSSIIRLRIPKGDRPPVEEMRHQAAGVAGLTTLIDLMQKCWQSKPDKRPTSHMCTTVTEELHKMHKHAVHDAVHQVLKKLEEEEERIIEQITELSITETSAQAPRAQPANICDSVPTGPPPVQEMAGNGPGNERHNTTVEDPSPGCSTNLCDVDQASSTAYRKMQFSSVEPIQKSSQSPLTHNSKAKIRSQPSYCQRQFSSPDTFPCHPSPQQTLNFHFSNVTGFQYGNNNKMYILPSESSERRRHPTAPSTVSSEQR